MKSAFATLLLSSAALLPAAAQVGHCPDVVATNVAARIDPGSQENQCVLTITLFGIEIGVHFGRCPVLQTVYPAHQECLGQFNEGTQCSPGEELEVRLQKCECSLLLGRTLGVPIPGCDCKDSGTAGTIEDAKTTPCVTQPLQGEGE